MYGLRCVEGLAQAAREQIRDRERMRTLSAVAVRHNHRDPAVLVEAHFGRLVMSEKRAHLQLRMFYQPQNFRAKRELIALIERYQCTICPLTLACDNLKDFVAFSDFVS